MGTGDFESKVKQRFFKEIHFVKISTTFFEIGRNNNGGYTGRVGAVTK